MGKLPKEYGYVAATGLATCVLVQGMGINVGRARKKFEVPYPKMYSETEKTFNCIQRIHQNTLEQQPSILFMLAIGGLKYPKTSAAFGLVWIVGRLAFAAGYSTGQVNKRRYGEFGYIGTLGLFATSVAVVLKKFDIL